MSTQLRRFRLVRQIVDSNPFYILSAMCMFAACWALTEAMAVRPGQLEKLFLLIGVVNVYEAMLILLGLYLIQRQAVKRDGLMLLLIESIFLADITFLAGECITTDLATGAAVNAVLLVLAVVKLWCIVRWAKLCTPVGEFAFIIGLLAILLTLPGIFGHMVHDGPLSPMALHAAWWLAGLLPVVHLLLRRLLWHPLSKTPSLQRHEAAIRWMYLLAPYAVLLIRLGEATWIYQQSFYACNLAPLCLGWSIWLAHTRAPAWAPHAAHRSQWLLPALAVVLSLSVPEELTVRIGQAAGLTVSPLRLVLIAAAASYVHGMIRFGGVAYLAAGLGMFLAAVPGHSVATIWRNLAGAIQSSGRTVSDQMPRTATQWGIAALVAAFTLLGMGAMISLRKSRRAIVDKSELSDPRTHWHA